MSFAAQAAAGQTIGAPAPMPAAVKDPNTEFTVNLEGIDPAKLVSKPLTEVQLDALVVLKIIKHCRDNHPVTAYGQLLGVDVAGVLEVTNCFPVTSKSQDDEMEGSAADEIDGAEYQLQMLRCLRKLNFDASSVGLYVSTHLGSFWNQTIIENQFSYQKAYAQSVLLVYDPIRTAQGNLSLRALRLSDTFMTLFKEKKFTMEALHAHKLTPSGIFESLPIRIRNSYLLSALLHELETTPEAPPSFPSTSFVNFEPQIKTSVGSAYLKSSASSGAATRHSASRAGLQQLSSSVGVGRLTPNFDALDLGADSYLEKHLEYLAETVEEYGQEQWRWQGWQRSLQKEQQKTAQTVAKKRAENATRTASGLPPLHSEEDITAPSPALAKILANEPSRLETLVITNQIDTYCKQVNQFAGPGLTKMFLAKAVARQN
ncbi:Eukaryotic translation initiation factor 3 subunit H [Blyttiomyces sp. JEL0837]|nr:Eukaryotic translation initiation factor 3 subunit H [Blyttiomyces sp. JEL0837]